jgi:hypothetical protein
MATISTARKVSTVAAAKVASPKLPAPFSGKRNIVRAASLGGVASLAFVEGKARAELISALTLALGTKPSEGELAACRLEFIVGRATAKLYATDVAMVDQFATTRDLVLHHAAPVKDGAKVIKLRAGQKGRRTIVQHKAIRAAEEAWSQIKAEIGAGTAQGQAAKVSKAKAKRNAKPAGTGITHTELVKGDGAPMDAASATTYLDGMALTMTQFANKHADKLPTDYGMAVLAFSKAILAAHKAHKALAVSIKF